jgi:hypothetical protein
MIGLVGFMIELFLYAYVLAQASLIPKTSRICDDPVPKT